MKVGNYDVIVVGTGPAGAVAAYELAKNGIHTALIEKETLPRYKTCGGGVVYRVRKLLEIDIQPVVERQFHEADLFLVEENLHYRVKRDKPIISMTMRDSLDHFLVKAAKGLGAELIENCTVKDLTIDTNVTLSTSNGEYQSKYIIAADGAFSPIAKMAGWKDTRYLIPALEFEVNVNDEDFDRFSNIVRFDIGMIPQGYGWMFPKTRHLSIGVASSKRGKLNLPEYYSKYLKFLGINNIESQVKHGFQIPVSPRKDGFFRNNILLTGDAAGFADPVTAEGISNAVFSGQLAAKSIIEGRLESKEVEKLYNKKLNSSIIPQLTIGRFLGKILYGQAWIRKTLFKKYGQQLSEALTDVFMGERVYPQEAVGRMKSYVKKGILEKN